MSTTTTASQLPPAAAADIVETVQDIQSSTKETNPHSEGIWVFGYGSLIWKPPIHYEQKYDLSIAVVVIAHRWFIDAMNRQIGYIKNYVRRFWQVTHLVLDNSNWGDLWPVAWWWNTKA